MEWGGEALAMAKALHPLEAQPHPCQVLSGRQWWVVSCRQKAAQQHSGNGASRAPTLEGL